MTRSNIDAGYIILNDNWPNDIDGISREIPLDGFLGAIHHNVVAPCYKIGEKRQPYDERSRGYTTFVYSQLGAQLATSYVVAKGSLVALHLASPQTWYAMSNIGTVATDPYPLNAVYPNLAAVCISAMTTAYYGWFWCGGVCPKSYVPGMDTADIPTDTSVVAGGCVAVYTAGTNDVLALKLADSAAETRAGIALAADD